MSVISPTLAERIERARQNQLREQARLKKPVPTTQPAHSKGDDRFSRWHVPETVEADGESWLLSYLDLITLLLAMLVVMLAVSRMHGQAYTPPGQEQPVALVGTLGKSGLPLYDGEYSEFETANIPASWAAPVTPEIHGSDQILAAAEMPAPLPTVDSLGLGDLGKTVDVIINEKSVSFRISNELLFPSGQATLSPAGLDVIKRLAGVLNKNAHPVSVEGHSDPVPIQTKLFPSNWELSASRATSVLRELVRDGVDGGRLRAVGYAETRPIESNETLAGRAANRRVELIMDIAPPQPVTTAQR